MIRVMIAKLEDSVFGTGSHTELMQKYVRVKVQMTYVRPHIIIKLPDSQFDTTK